jgi:hypothetical protein
MGLLGQKRKMEFASQMRWSNSLVESLGQITGLNLVLKLLP